jgi:hypothetical protein
MTATGAVLFSLGVLGVSPAIMLMLATVSVSGGPGDPTYRVGGAALAGAAGAFIIGGATLIAVGTGGVPASTLPGGTPAGLTLTPTLGPGFVGLDGRF